MIRDYLNKWNIETQLKLNCDWDWDWDWKIDKWPIHLLSEMVKWWKQWEKIKNSSKIEQSLMKNLEFNFQEDWSEIQEFSLDWDGQMSDLSLEEPIENCNKTEI